VGFVPEPDDYEDVKDDGAKDADGNCLGQIQLFSGVRQECRYVSAKTGFFNCCESNNAWKTQFYCPADTNMIPLRYEDAAKCGEICGKPCELVKKAPPDLENFFGLFKCKAEEKQLAFKRSMFPDDGGCRYIGKRCSERWKLGRMNVCVQEKGTYCCFDSPLAKIIIEAAHVQLNIPWGSANSPNCSGLTPEQFQKLNLDDVDFSNWIDNYVTPAVTTQMQKAMEGLQQ
jgi:hypothetical protein